MGVLARRALMAVVTLSAIAALGTTAVVSNSIDRAAARHIIQVPVPPVVATASVAETLQQIHTQRMQRIHERTQRLESQQQQIIDRISRMEER